MVSLEAAKAVQLIAKSIITERIKAMMLLKFFVIE
jgi:hypothetical protein